MVQRLDRPTDLLLIFNLYYEGDQLPRPVCPGLTQPGLIIFNFLLPSERWDQVNILRLRNMPIAALHGTTHARRPGARSAPGKIRVLVYFFKEIPLINHPGARSAPGKFKVLVYFLKGILKESLINHPGAGSAPGRNHGFVYFLKEMHKNP